MCMVILGETFPMIFIASTRYLLLQIFAARRVLNSRADMNIIVKDLQDMSVFTEITGRCYPSFPNPRNILHAKPSATVDWIQRHENFNVISL